MSLMAFSDSEVYTDKTCSKTCLKNYETLKKQCDDLIVKLNQTELTCQLLIKKVLGNSKAITITYRKKNEVLFSEEVAVLKREVACKDYEINVLKSEFEKVKQEKEGIEFKIEKFDKASKDLDKLLESQITDKSKKGLGYSAVPPPHPLIYNRPKKLDLSYSGLDEFKEPEFKGYGPENSKQESNIVCDKKSDDSKENSDNSLVKEQVSKDTSSFVESSLNVDKETVFPVDKKVESVKPKDHEKPVKKSVRYAEMYRSQSPRGNQRNWNGQKSNQLGSDFVMYNKACFICESFNHVQAQCKNHQRESMVYGNIYNRVNYNYTTKRTHPNAQRNMVPRAVLMKTGLKTFKTARTVNTALSKSIGKPQHDDTGFVDSGCSRHMTRNIAYLSNFKEFDGMLHLEEEHMVVESLVPDESQILLKIPRKDNMYSFDMKNIIPNETLTCLVAKATSDESILWHRRLGHINFKNINKLVKDNLVRGLPTKSFENDQTCVACLKGKQHRASCKSKVINPITKPLFMLHMDLFGPTFVSSLMHKKYCLVVTDDYSRFTWVFFLETKDETSEILKNLIKEIENLVPGLSANGVAERRITDTNWAARTMLGDYKLPTTFWAEAVSTACYVKNRVLVVKPHNKTPYELSRDSLGKFDGKSDEGFFVGYSLSSKAFRYTKCISTGTSEEISQDCIVMPIWKDASYFDSPYKDVDNGEPKSAADDQKKDGDEPTSIAKALSDSSWVEAMQEEHLQFKLQKVWILVDLPSGKRAIGTKWVFRNKKDERGIVIRNKARLVAQGHGQEEGIDYEEVFAPVTRIEAIRLFLAYASFMGFLVYQMDVKSAFLYGTIEEEVYVTQPPGFKDPNHAYKVYKVYVDDNIFGSINKDLCTGFEKLMKDKFQMSSIRELTFFLGLQVQQKEDEIFISRDKYVVEILNKFNYTDVKFASTLVDLEKPLVKDGDADDVDVHLYRSIIRDSPFELVAYTDSNYAGVTQDRKSTTGGCQFLGNRLISWQCKKQTVVATSTTKAEYVAAASCCGQVLWIQNQLLDYGYNFMNTIINIDNNNLLTKGFDAGRFQYLVSSIGMLNP
ncbi:retrovirus-related pol polyprotein from transposon TNT 1-94 [Tanacetum coccineum]